MHLVSFVISTIKMRYQKWEADLLPAAIARHGNSQNLDGRPWGSIGGPQQAKTVRGECGVLPGTL